MGRKRVRLRPHIEWEPVWDGYVRNWTVGFIKKNLWRCDKVTDFDDLLQDAYLIFVRIRERYPRVVEPRHFMALFRTTMSNEMCNISRRQQQREMAIKDLDCDPCEYAEVCMSEFTNEGYLRALLSKAPHEIKRALAIISNEVDTIAPRSAKPQPRENMNMRLNRILGSRGIDFVGDIKAMLT